MTVALSTDFLEAYAGIPRGQQKKAREFIEQFQLHPTSGGIQYEKLHAGQDLYSVRIDNAWRAIIFHPPQGEVYVLCWIDHHDAAYRWAEHKKFSVHPATGALQIVDAASVAPPLAPAAAASPALFEAIKDKHLLRLGVPVELLTRVRAMRGDGDLEAAHPTLPQEAYEALLMLAMGFSLDEVFREMDKSPAEASIPAGAGAEMVPAGIATADVATALEHADSKRRFFVVHDSGDLAEVLNAPLEKWRVFLHPQQRKLVELRANGPVRVLGGAGTGKTVVAMHRARFLAEQVFRGPHDRILFTTFTRILAVDIESQLRQICSVEAMGRIEVVNLDAWVGNFLRKHGFRYEVVFGDEDDVCWRAALASAPPGAALSADFYRAEWEDVVQAQNITDVDQYVRAPRLGRGTRLARESKRAIWPVFQEYRAQLNEHGKREYVDLVREARSFIAQSKTVLPYRAVVVDETQDMSAAALRLIRALVPAGANDLFLVGDAFQRIYRHRASLGQCGIEIRGRGKKLKINYRTTEETRRFAISLLEGIAFDDLDSGSDEARGYISLLHGQPPLIEPCPSFTAECDFLADRVRRLASEGSPLASICVTLRTRALADAYRDALAERSIPVFELKRDHADRPDQVGVRIATMHRVKGLEFDHILVAGADAGTIPLRQALPEDDAVGRRNAEIRERSLLFVALTRARKSAAISGYGAMSPFLAAAAVATAPASERG
ncbi:MAG TPA: UvrD-helicase domain-containing protein [Terriglobales bacterium]|nr:UvrD-helicase domain-containing protein [Terriglobales bacterium]